MVITYYGISCFKVQSGELTIAFDPPSRQAKVKLPRFEADIILSSHDHALHNGLEELPGKKGAGKPFLVSGPGEYELYGVSIRGVPSFHDPLGGEKLGRNTMYALEMEDITVCHTGDLGETELRDRREELGEVDILLVPIGGNEVLDPKAGAKLAHLLEPKVVIPMHYGNAKAPDRREEFLREMGEEKVRPEERITLKKKDLASDGMRVVLLEPAINL